jgi:hypothetical protein
LTCIAVASAENEEAHQFIFQSMKNLFESEIEHTLPISFAVADAAGAARNALHSVWPLIIVFVCFLSLVLGDPFDFYLCSLID